ncbi:MAG: hypothetical protein JXA44_03695 [Methanospirillaceae archaeon]|nr:hypothetical protein [Methanospirillaceae archaeon]
MTDTEKSEPSGEDETGLTEPKKSGRLQKRHYLLICTGLIVLVIVLLFAASLATTTIQLQLPATGGVTYPYTTTYGIEMQEGMTHTIGDINILFLAIDDEIFLSIGDEKVRMEIGEKKKITERHATIKTLGFVLFDSNYMILAQYLGMTGDNAKFHITLKTSEQIPGFLLERILPAEISAVPV